MSALDRIPMPGLPGDDLAKLPNDILSNMLKKAQAQEAYGKATEATMKSDLLKSLMNGGGMGQGQVEQQGQGNITNKLGISKQELARGLLGLSSQSPEEKEASDIRVSQKREQNASNIKQGVDLKGAASDLKEMDNIIKEIDKIHKRNKDLTGPAIGSKFGKITGLAPKDVARLQYLFGRVQTLTNSQAMKNPGIGGFRAVGEFKPKTTYSQKYNEGLMDSMRQAHEQAVKEVQEQYKNTTGEELPIKFAEQQVSDNEDKGLIWNPHKQDFEEHTQ